MAFIEPAQCLLQDSDLDQCLLTQQSMDSTHTVPVPNQNRDLSIQSRPVNITREIQAQSFYSIPTPVPESKEIK